MNKIIKHAMALLVISTNAMATVIDFDDNALAADSYFDPQAQTVWSSNGTDFTHEWEFDCCWAGFTYSNRTDTTTAGFSNDRSAITGDGVGAGQDNYAVATPGFLAGDPTLAFDRARVVQGGYFTNVTYTYYAIKNGDDGNQFPFVKGPFGEGDFYKLTATGLGAGGETLGSVEFLLADGADVLDEWAWFDMTGLGEVYGVRFSLSSSDNGSFGMNTPAYFAVDNLSVVPLPGAVWLFASALTLLGWRRSKRRLQRASRVLS